MNIAFLTQSRPSRPMSSRHHISMEHRLQVKHLLLNPNVKASSGMYVEGKRKKKHLFQEKQKTKNWEHEKISEKHENFEEKRKRGLKGSTPYLPRRLKKLILSKEML